MEFVPYYLNIVTVGFIGIALKVPVNFIEPCSVGSVYDLSRLFLARYVEPYRSL